MAQAIERPHAIIICMSDHYQKSNFCRTEVQYAFQRKLKMIPILLQQHYKPNGWLSLIISRLLYVDFTKYEFSKAIEILLKELKLAQVDDNGSVVPVQSKINLLVQSIPATFSTKLPSEQTVLPNNIREWTSSHVYRWLSDNNLPEMVRILSDVDAPGLIYLSEYIISGESQQILLSLQQDSHQRSNEDLLLVELARFRSLIEKEGLTRMTSVKVLTQANPTITNSNHSKCCNIM
ncbi:unnamed protein product [Rotaria sp. Silwood2]|nr:unnamed protein product [Rotaria sp. Silwood2]